jgi:Exopolysaccharide biosynthesis protein related to N-acetylglucosamine-1-phosphodiester alpha-N-acetylglucosaminidase
MFTSDGRLTHSPGMEASEVAQYLRELGCTDAVMLDGGGSTELIAKGAIKNTLTDGSERAILNAFAVKSLSQKGAFDHMDGYLGKATAYVGEGVPVKLTFHDASGNQLDVGAASASFTSSGISGYYSNGSFIPTSAGKGTVTASYGGTSISFELEAIEKTSSDSLFDAELTKDDLQGGTTLAFLGDMSMPKEQKLMDRLIVSKLQDSIASLPGAKAVVIGNRSSTGTAKLSGKVIDVKSGYKATAIDSETAVVTLENSSGTFYKEAGQWNFINTILSSNYKNVVVVFTSKSQLGFAEEVRLFKENVYHAAKDKNICVVYKGSEFSQTAEGNARYVSIPDYADLGKGDFWNDYKYLAINIKPDGIKYGHLNIFK